MEIKQETNHTAPILLVYGAEGRGKTTLASKLPDAVWFLLEQGLPRGVTVASMQSVNSFEGVLNGLRFLANEEHPYKALVIDTLDALEPYVIEHVCAQRNWKDIEQPSYGKGWLAADDTWRRFLNGLNIVRIKRGMAIVLTAHATIERIDDPRAPTYTSYQPKLHKRARALVMDACDIIGFLSEDLRVVTDDGGFRERTRATAGNGRYLFVEGRPAFAAKNRYGMPEKLPIPLDFNIENLMRYWT
jgi:RecA/RadA recombinase